MRKVSKRIEVGECTYWRKGKKLFDYQPKNTKVKHYLYDEEAGEYTAVVRARVPWCGIITVLLVCLSYYLYSSSEKLWVKVSIPYTIYSQGSTLELNILNLEGSYPVEISVSSSILPEELTYKLEPGEGIGTVRVTDLQPFTGTVDCVVKCRVRVWVLPVEKEYSALIVER